MTTWVSKIRKVPNRLEDYKTTTVRLDRLFKYYEYEEGIYPLCKNCDKMKHCYLLRRTKKKEKLYHQIPTYSSEINAYYKAQFHYHQKTREFALNQLNL